MNLPYDGSAAWAVTTGRRLYDRPFVSDEAGLLLAEALSEDGPIALATSADEIGLMALTRLREQAAEVGV